VLREDELAVGEDVEDAAIAPDELGLDAEPLGERGLQTGGPGPVVSAAAVVDGDLHAESPGWPFARLCSADRASCGRRVQRRPRSVKGGRFPPRGPSVTGVRAVDRARERVDAILELEYSRRVATAGVLASHGRRIP